MNETFHLTDDKDKMGMIERVNSNYSVFVDTFRNMKHFTLRNTFKWIDVVQDIEYNYNHTVHSTLRRAPIEMTVNDIEKKRLEDMMHTDSIREKYM
jgi:hypothetical protein